MVAITEYMAMYPVYSIAAISFLVTLVMTFLTKKVTDQNRMRELKDVQKACQIKLKDSKGDALAMGKINKELMECSMELMKHSFRPMMYTFIPLLLLIYWVRGFYTEILSTWLWWYMGAGIASSIILRKVLKVV